MSVWDHNQESLFGKSYGGCPAGSRDCLLFRSTWVYPRFFGGVHVVHLFLVFGVVSVLFLSCPCCSPEFVSYCWFPFALNIPLVFLYFSYSPFRVSFCSWQIKFSNFSLPRISHCYFFISLYLSERRFEK